MSVKVLYIIGKGRSGSTLIDRLLGEIEGYVSTGELWKIWQRGILGNEPCGCGMAMRKCDFWLPILEETIMQAQHIEGLRSRLLRWRRSPSLLFSLRETDEYQELCSHFADIYKQIQKKSGARVIVDSSKWPIHPGILGDIEGIDPYVLQLVRHPYAVAYSWQKRKQYHGSSSQQWMLQFPAWHSGVSWSLRNAIANVIVARCKESAMILRYEDLIGNPTSSLMQIAELLGEIPADLSFIQEKKVFFSGDHTVGGNPNRFQSGPISLQIDDEWRVSLSSIDKKLLYLLTAVSMRQFGYRPD